MNIVSEVLDNQLVDRSGVRMGRADGLVAIVPDGERPYVAFIESGPLTAIARLPRFAQPWLHGLLRWFGNDRTRSFRIPWSKVLDVGIDIDIDVDARDTPAFAAEHWVRDRIIRRIPGG